MLTRERGIRDAQAPCEVNPNYETVGPIQIIEQTGEAVLLCRRPERSILLFNTRNQSFREVHPICEDTQRVRSLMRRANSGAVYTPQRNSRITLNRVLVTEDGGLVYICSELAGESAPGSKHGSFAIVVIHPLGSLSSPEIMLIRLPEGASNVAPLGYDANAHSLAVRISGSAQASQSAVVPLEPNSEVTAQFRLSGEVWGCPEHPMIRCGVLQVLPVPGTRDHVAALSLRFARLPSGSFAQNTSQFLPPQHPLAGLASGNALLRLDGETGQTRWIVSQEESLADVHGLSASTLLVAGPFEAGMNQSAMTIDVSSGRIGRIPVRGTARGGFSVGALSPGGRFAVLKRYDNRILIYDLRAGVVRHDDAVATIRSSNTRETLFVSPPGRIFSIRSDEVAYLGTVSE